MSDPLSYVAIGAAIGGAAGKFVEKAWDSGEKWITTYYANHRPRAVEKAQENSADFLSDLATRIKMLEDRGAVSKEQIENSQDHPDFSGTLHKAMLTAAQTDDHDKHQLLARILAERLAAPAEGLRAMASKMACDVVGYMTPGQLRLLGLVVELLYIRSYNPVPADVYRARFESRLSPYATQMFTSLDLLHLESLSCLRYLSFASHDLGETLAEKNGGVYDTATLETPLGIHIKSLWEQGLQAIELTSVGQLIGTYVADSLTHVTASFDGWD
jgi:hypothetical protein